MRFHRSVCVALAIAVSLGAQVGRGEDEVEILVPPPDLIIAVANGDNIEFRYVVEKPVREAKGENNDAVREETMIAETRIRRIEARTCQTTRIDGTLVSTEDLLKELATAKAVILLRPNYPLHSQVRSMFKPETLVLRDIPSDTLTAPAAGAAPGGKATLGKRPAKSQFVPPPQ